MIDTPLKTPRCLSGDDHGACTTYTIGSMCPACEEPHYHRPKTARSGKETPDVD